jgi:hypothetical protein
VNITQAAPAVKVGRVRSISRDEKPRNMSEPLLLTGAAADWPALSRWKHTSNAFSEENALSLHGTSSEIEPAPLSHDMVADLNFEKLGLVEHELSITLGPFGGSGLHRMPMPQDAWCPIIWGRRHWVFCAPGSEVELVDGEQDLLDPDVRYRLSRRGLDIRECEQSAGDVICIPAGWWWQVRDLEPTLAVVAIVQILTVDNKGQTTA